MKRKYIFLFFLFLLIPIQVFAKEAQNLGCDPFVQNVGFSTINNRCKYSDNTFSASSVSGERVGCCEYYLNLLSFLLNHY